MNPIEAVKSSTALPLDVERLRADFPILATRLHDNVPLIYFDNAATTQRPRQVIQSLVDVYEKQYANVHRGIHWLSDQSTDLFEEARRKVQVFIGATAREEVIFTHGATESINLVARSWGDANLKPGDELLLSEMEHHANIVPWQQLAVRTGAVLRFVPISDDGQLLLDEFDKLVTERTRLVAVTAVSNVLGTVNPVGEIVRRAHAAGAIVLVDAAQSVPHAPVDVQALGADFLAFSGHKMLGPSGVGVLYGRRELLDAMPPFLGGGSMIRRVRLDGFEPADLPDKFEAGTPPIVPAIEPGCGHRLFEPGRSGSDPHAGADSHAPRARGARERGWRAILGSRAGEKGRDRQFRTRASSRSRHRSIARSPRHRDPRGPSLCDAAAQAVGRSSQRPPELLFLQHADGSRSAGRGLR